MLNNEIFNYLGIKRDKKLLNWRKLSIIFSGINNSRKQFKCLPANEFPLLEIFTGSKSQKKKKNKQPFLRLFILTPTVVLSPVLEKIGYIYKKIDIVH